MNEEKEFFEELDEVVQCCYKEIKKIISDSKTSIKIYSIEFEAELNEEIKIKYKLNGDIKFIIEANTNEGITNYYYKGNKIEPINYYVRPENYHEVSTLTLLQECIIQDTNKPDIRFLERGERRNKN